MKNEGGKKASPRYMRFGVFIVDGEGLAVRCFGERKAAFGWIRKHWPGMEPAEARSRVMTFGSRQQVSRFFNEQIRKGNSNAEVLALMTYYCGTATARGMDLKSGRVFKTAGKR